MPKKGKIPRYEDKKVPDRHQPGSGPGVPRVAPTRRRRPTNTPGKAPPRPKRNR